MKVAIYTISKNEEKHVRRWFNSVKDADYWLIADTGSTDKTVEIARELGITVVPIYVNPFRFDDARNASLALLPANIDYCIALDLDETMSEGWREELQKAFDENIDRPTYRRIESFNPDGTANSEFDGFKVHRRQNMRWHYPIHEVPHWYGQAEESRKKFGFEIHHRQDRTKSRHSYLPLLEMAVKENPDARNLYYLGREYFNFKRPAEALENFKKYLELSVFPEERSYACRLMAKCDEANAEEHLIKSTEEHSSRESLMALANHYYMTKQWDECLLVSKRALDYTVKPVTFLSENWAWGHMAYDLIAISSWQLNDFPTALEYGMKALEISPNDERLKTNVEFYQEKVNNGNTRRDGG
jgi:glycosyltransferase involved in cell wall biosynthesis